MSDEHRVYVEVTPTSKDGDADSMLYEWSDLKRAFEDAELTLDGDDNGKVTLRIVINPKITKEEE
jgi:hypothetical protein